MAIFKDDRSKDLYAEKEKNFFSAVGELVSEYGLDLEAQTKNLGSFQRRMDFPKQLAIYELFRRTKEIPGSVLDFGVYRGGSFLVFHHLLETFFPGERSKKVFGFDNFKGYEQETSIQLDTDRSVLKQALRDQMLSDTDFRYMQKLLELHEDDSYLPGVPRGELVDGDICETLPRFLDENPALRYCYINVDVNLYEPVKCILQHTWGRLMRGGVMAFSGYPNEPWVGESSAVDEFFNDTFEPQVTLQALGWSTYPRSYLIKQ